MSSDSIRRKFEKRPRKKKKDNEKKKKKEKRGIVFEGVQVKSYSVKEK